ncbi:MAG: dihydrodipicolinate synthase family protein [Spirosomataceae bacterium]
MKNRITGLIPAALTPMYANGDIRPEIVSALYRHYRQNNLKSVFVNGSTGEFQALSVAERKELVAAWTETAESDFSVIVHVGSCNLRESVEMAEHAADCGAAAISILSPYYFKPSTLDSLIECCATVANSVDLPFYYYHLPVLTNVNFPMIQFLEKAPQRINNLAGIKYSTPDFVDFRQCLMHQNQQYDVFFGVDEMILSALALGSYGAVGSTYNFISDLYHQLIEAFGRGDHETAAYLQEKAVEYINVLAKFGYSAASKAVMKMQGVACGTVRLPFRNISDNQVLELEKELQQIGFFEFAGV